MFQRFRGRAEADPGGALKTDEQSIRLIWAEVVSRTLDDLCVINGDRWEQFRPTSYEKQKEARWIEYFAGLMQGAREHGIRVFENSRTREDDEVIVLPTVRAVERWATGTLEEFQAHNWKQRAFNERIRHFLDMQYGSGDMVLSAFVVTENPLLVYGQCRKAGLSKDKAHEIEEMAQKAAHQIKEKAVVRLRRKTEGIKSPIIRFIKRESRDKREDCS